MDSLDRAIEKALVIVQCNEIFKNKGLSEVDARSIAAHIISTQFPKCFEKMGNEVVEEYYEKLDEG